VIYRSKDDINFELNKCNCQKDARCPRDNCCHNYRVRYRCPGPGIFYPDLPIRDADPVSFPVFPIEQPVDTATAGGIPDRPTAGGLKGGFTAGARAGATAGVKRRDVPLKKRHI